MSSTVIDRPATREQHTIPVARLHTQPGFNPRTKRDKDKYAGLVKSVQRRGVLQPILVAPHSEIDGEFVIIAGESRYLAACEAGLTEIPCVLDVPDAETGGLVDALLENLVRDDLSPMDEARAFDRLREHGLSVSGIAERVSRTTKLVRERLQLLVLPAKVQREIEKGTVPLTAAPALVKLAEMHEELPALAVAKVMKAPDRDGYGLRRQSTWKDLSEDPIGVVLAAGYTMELPSDVYVGGGEFALECFTLSDKAERDLAKLLEIAVVAARDDVRVTFGRDLTAQAGRLSATYDGANGQILIIGQDVADQLAGDAIAAQLREARAREERVLVEHRQQLAAATNGASAPGPDAKEKTKAVQREQDKQARRLALGYNESLGAAVVQAFARVKIDIRVLKILAAISFDRRLGDIAALGARYCLPFGYWQQSRRLDSGVVKIEIVDAAHCAEPARTWIEGARGQAELVGRLLTLAVLARFADQNALPNSRRAHSQLHSSHAGELPWTTEVTDYIDDIAGELLPDHLTAHILEPKREERRRIEDARSLLDRALAEPSALTDKELKGAMDAAYDVLGYGDDAREARQRIDAERKARASVVADSAQETTPATDDKPPADGGEDPGTTTVDEDES